MIRSYAKRLFGVVTVEQRDTTVTVEGVNVGRLAHDILKEWKTGRISMNLFYDIRTNSFKTGAFFVPELLYIIEKLLGKSKIASSRRGLLALETGLKNNTWWAEVEERLRVLPKPRLDKKALNKFIHSPMPANERFFSQYEFETNILGKHGLINGGKPGTGKTYMCLAIAEMLHADFVFIVAPKNSMERPWRQAMNAEDLYKVPQEYWMAKDNDGYDKQRFIIGHYEALDAMIEVAKKVSKRNIVVILDECHYFNEMTSQRVQKFIELCQITQSRDILWASGTPIKSMGYEVVPFLITTDPLFGKDDQQRFLKAFGREGKRGADILRNRMERIMAVIEKDEIRKDEPTFHTVPVQVKDAKRFTLDSIRQEMRDFIEERFKYYKSVEDIIVEEYETGVELFKEQGRYNKKDFDNYRACIRVLRSATDYGALSKEIQFTNRYEKTQIIPMLDKDVAKKFINAKSAYKYLPLKIQGECLGRVVGKAREQCTVAIAEALDFDAIIRNAGSKTVVFSSYIASVEATMERLKKSKDYQPLFFYGKNSSSLGGVLDTFAKDGNANPLVTTFKSLSVAVPLVMANTEILLDSPFRPYILEQTVSRVDRKGQTLPTHIHVCRLDTGSSPNISTRSIDIMNWAKEQVEAITGVKSSYEVSDNGASLEHFTDWETQYAMEAFDEIGTVPSLNTSSFASLRW